METPPVERARILGRFKMLMEENFEDIVRSNTREHGKTLVESRGDVKRGLEVVEFALGVPSLMMGEVLENIARGIDCEAITRSPLGVCVRGITPFNFPAMVPLWMYPIAIVCGNTFVLKPSEKSSAHCHQDREAAGESRAAERRAEHRFTAGAKLWTPCLRIRKSKPSRSSARRPSPVTSTRPARSTAKRVQSNGGAKNYVIIMPDADAWKTQQRGVIEAAFGCRG